MNDYLSSIVRTVIPVVVAFVLAQAARAGLDLPADDVTGLIETVVLGLYYAGVRAAEQRWPAVGWLLGLPREPHYAPPNVIVEQPKGEPDVIVDRDA